MPGDWGKSQSIASEKISTWLGLSGYNRYRKDVMLFSNEAVPTCINHGCNTPVTYSSTNKQGQKRYRPVCGRCQKASYGALTYALGVTPFVTGRCSNQDAHLGWRCPIDYDLVPMGMVTTEIDHVDGDHRNNVLDNCQELCSLCHREKGRRNGDLRGHRY